jgi:hypothetical protein
MHSLHEPPSLLTIQPRSSGLGPAKLIIQDRSGLKVSHARTLPDGPAQSAGALAGRERRLDSDNLGNPFLPSVNAGPPNPGLMTSRGISQ